MHAGDKALINMFSDNNTTNTLSSGPFSPSNIDTKSEMPPEPKRKVKSPIQDSILTVKAEPPWDLDSLHSIEKRSNIEYTIDMDAQTIIKLCKYVYR